MTTVRSSRLEADLHLGKRAARPPTSDHVLFEEVLKALPPGALPPIPTHFGHGLDFGRAGWLMLGNGPDDTVFPGFQGCGDCVFAGAAHEEMEAARNSGRAALAFSGKVVVGDYSAYSGYDPRSGNNDNGSDVQEVLARRQTIGIHDSAGTAHKIGKTIALTPKNIDQLWAATYLFECVGVGFNFQQAQMDQFDAGQPWDYVAGSPIEGGHYVPTMGDNGLITWGHRVAFTPAFIEHLADEAYAYLDLERYNVVTGQTLEHFADADLERFATSVIQLKTVE